MNDTDKPAKRPKKVHYVNNKDLYEAMVIYKREYNANQGVRPQISNYIATCIMLISRKLADKPCFSGYSYKDEMIADGIENCFMYMHNFDPDKYSNPFAYFTQIAYYAFVRRIQKEKKEQYVKLKNIEYHFTFDEVVEGTAMDKTLYENNMKYIETFEKSMSDKKKKTKATGLEKFAEDQPNE